MQVFIVSACLAGVRCRYDGKSNEIPAIRKMVEEGMAIAVCPELLGGLDKPRPCCELKHHESGTFQILNCNFVDQTKEFQSGAQKTLEIARIIGAKIAILKQRSPSCGCGQIYDGSFSGKIIQGNGVTASLLLANGIQVYTEENIPETMIDDE